MRFLAPTLLMFPLLGGAPTKAAPEINQPEESLASATRELRKIADTDTSDLPDFELAALGDRARWLVNFASTNRCLSLADVVEKMDAARISSDLFDTDAVLDSAVADLRELIANDPRPVGRWRRSASHLR